MATSTGTHRTISRRFLVTAAAGALAVAAVAGAGTWRLTHNGATKSAVTTSAQVQQPQPQTSAVQAAAVPAPLSHTVSGPALDNSLVLVSSDTQAATLQQAFADADAIRFGMGLAPLNASVVAAPSDQQGIDAANAIRAAMGEPPLTAPDESYASIIADENTLRASLGLTPIALIDLR